MSDEQQTPKMHTEDAIQLVRKTFAEGQRERLTHVVLTFGLMSIILFSTYLIIPALVSPVAVIGATVVVVYELKSQEILLHSTMTALIGVVEAFRIESSSKQ